MSPYIYLSYGIPKSGSTLAFELTKAAFEQNGCPQIRLSGFATDAQSVNFIDHFPDEVAERLLTAVECIGYPIVVKTHGPLTPAVHRLLENGNAIGQCVYRDPREIILSLLDAGERARRKGRKAFSEVTSIEFAAERVMKRIAMMKEWMAAPNVIPLFYSDIAFKTRKVVRVIADQIGLPVDAERAERTVKLSKFTQFNKGQKDRYLTDLSPGQNHALYLEFKDFIDAYCHSLVSPEPDVADAVIRAPEPAAASAGPPQWSDQAARSRVPPVGRMDQCPCGSGKRYKQCHGLLS